MLDWVKEHKPYVVVAVLIALGGIYYFYYNEPAPSVPTSMDVTENNLAAKQEQTADVTKVQPEKIIVDVKGQVAKPGVYEGFQGERVVDVIDRAGGLTKLADASQVNFAEHVVDEMVIYIPGKGEEGPPAVLPSTSIRTSTTTSGGNGGKVDLNKADETELQTLPGIGPAKAAAIIEYREKSGKFKTVEDIKNISGIGDKTFDKLKDQIIVH